MTKMKFLVLALLVSIQALKAQNNIHVENKVKDILEPFLISKTWSGAILIEKEGDVKLQKGYGLFNLKEDEFIQKDTKFLLGELSSIFVPLATLKLVEEGKINLENKLAHYFPNVEHEISIHNLLSGSSGLKPLHLKLDSLQFEKLRQEETSQKELLKVIFNSKLEFEPGTKLENNRFNIPLSKASSVSYGRIDFFVLSMIIEQVTGMQYHQYVRDEIIKPLKLKNTGFLEAGSKKGIAQAYMQTEKELVPSPKILFENFNGVLSMYSTVGDLLEVVKAIRSYKLLNENNSERIMTAYSGDEVGHRFTYGWAYVKEPNGNRIIYASSEDYGLKNNIIFHPETQYTLIILSNIGEMTKNIHPSTYKAYRPRGSQQPLYDLISIYQKPDGISMADFIKENMATKGIEKTISCCENIKEEIGVKYYTDENEMNKLGYDYLNEGCLQEAVVTFKLNTLFFPESSNAFDSYAEGLMRTGELQKATESYKKSLHLNSKNLNAEKMLKRIEAMQLTEVESEFLSFKKNEQVIKSKRTYQIALGDIDLDGDLDAIFANMGLNHSEIYINNGKGSFTPSGQKLTQQGHGIAIEDFDKDGDLDLFITCAGYSEKGEYYSKPSKIYFNNGKGVFADSGQDLGDKEMSGNGVVAGDFNNDGNVDVLVKYYKHKDIIYLNNSKGYFSASKITVPENAAFGDMDNDGDIDAFVKKNGVGYEIYLNNDMEYQLHSSIHDTVAMGLGDLALSDFDNDGDIDCIVTNGHFRSASYSAKVYHNNGKASFALVQDNMPAVSNSTISIGDLNMDGFADIILTDFGKPVLVWLNNKKGQFYNSGIAFGNGDVFRRSPIGDINGDGLNDVFLSNFDCFNWGGNNDIWFNNRR